MTIIHAIPLRQFGISGPLSSVNNEVPVFDGTTGRRQKAGTGFIITADLMQAENKAILVSGTTGGTPASGAGTRMMWIPAKGAFRAGKIGMLMDPNDQWNDANVGYTSFAIGFQTKASGLRSVACGYKCEALGSESFCAGRNGVAYNEYSTHFGNGGAASGISAIHFGYSGVASNYASTHFGSNGVASGKYSVHFGEGGLASGDFSVCTGQDGLASDKYAVHFGYDGEASGPASAHFGYQGKASAFAATHFGYLGKAEGNYSIVGGVNMQLSAAAYSSFAFGYHSSPVALTQPDTFYIFPSGSAGKLALGVTVATAMLDVGSDVVRLRTAKTPVAAGAAGSQGDVCFDSDFGYRCVSTNVWKRWALSTW